MFDEIDMVPSRLRQIKRMRRKRDLKNPARGLISSRRAKF
jgi:hypothetical protein